MIKTLSTWQIPYLAEISEPPEKIFYKGSEDLILSKELKIAIVGTRRATDQGLATAYKLAKELAERKIIIVSGLALGIDQAAHQGCLEGGGKTIAVLAGGLDQIYPRQHEPLAEKIIKSGGAIISQYPEKTVAFPNQFLERNRIISGLSKGVIIVEAPFGSGALNTANHALEQNREVLVVPGAIFNNNYSGSNELIKQGASLITSFKDVLNYFNVKDEANCDKLSLPKINFDQKTILQIIKTTDKPLTADKLAELSGLSIETINETLTAFVIEGLLSESGGKYFILN